VLAERPLQGPVQSCQSQPSGASPLDVSGVLCEQIWSSGSRVWVGRLSALLFLASSGSVSERNCSRPTGRGYFFGTQDQSPRRKRQSRKSSRGSGSAQYESETLALPNAALRFSVGFLGDKRILTPEWDSHRPVFSSFSSTCPLFSHDSRVTGQIAS
jgi:hypothetical protein